MKKTTRTAFTLAEIMIVLTVIGILTAIILPSARNLMPDKNLMKFKKAHNMFATAIAELVNSDKYYCNGDLGIMADCETTVTDYEGKRTHLCQSLADVLNVKKVSCYEKSMYTKSNILLTNEFVYNVATGDKVTRELTPEKLQAAKKSFDTYCMEGAVRIGAEIITAQNVTLYQSGTNQFGSYQTAKNDINGLEEDIELRYFSPPGQFPANYGDQNGFDISYKIYCIDIDGIPDDVTLTDCVNECPFGYGIRADGKIMSGAKADEWLKKDTVN